MPSWIFWLMGIVGGVFAATSAKAKGGTPPTPTEGGPLVPQPDAFYRWDPLLRKYGDQYSVPWRWMKAIMMQESDLGRAPSVAYGLVNPADVDGSASDDGKSWGLMQLTLATARGLEGSQIEEPYLNVAENSIRLAAELLAQLIRRFGIHDRQSVVRAYNGGPSRPPATAAYYTKFVAHIATVLQYQPGDELEGYN